MKTKRFKTSMLIGLLCLLFVPVSAQTARLQSVSKNGNTDKATIKLIVEEVWGDNSGYHLLLDSTATMYDEYYIYGLSSNLEKIYEATTSRMPEDADMTYSSFVAENSSDSIQINPGTYDMLIINVAPNAPVYAGLEYSNTNNISFVAGLTYVFTVTLAENGSSHTTSYSPPVEMELSQLLLPATGCGMDSLTVSIGIRNNGGDFPAGLNAKFTIDGSNDTVSETIGFDIRSGQDTLYHFQGKLPLAKGLQAVVRAWIDPEGKDSAPKNNSASGIVLQHEALALPHHFDMATEMAPGDENAYVVTDSIAFNFVQETPLVSACFEMKAGIRYRLSYQYIAGTTIAEAPSTYHVLFGQAALPIEDWDIAKTESNAYSLDFIADEILLEVEENGTYAFCFLPDEYSVDMAFQDIRIDTLPEFDLCIQQFHTDLPSILLSSQLSNRSFHGSATISNRGYADIDSARIQILSGDNLLYETYTDLDYNTEKKLEWELALKDLPVGLNRITAKIDMIPDQDAYQADNFAYDTITVSDSIMAYDRMPDDPDEYWGIYSVGSEEEIEFGLPFHLTAGDTLTGISVGWTKEEENDISLVIYAWNDSLQLCGETILDMDTKKGTRRGQTLYPVKPLILDSGSYMFAVRLTGFGLAADMKEGGVLYVTSYDPILKQTDLGFPSIRAVFGATETEQQPADIPDVAVLEILHPADSGRFSSQETISALIENKNAYPASFSVYLNVNGEMFQQDVQMAALSRQEVGFQADLSKAGTYYELTLFTSLDGDTDRSNDTLSKTVYCTKETNNESAAAKASLDLYPNPVSQLLHIKSSAEAIQQVSIMNVNGRMITDSRGLCTQEFRLNVESLSPGLYLARVRTEAGWATLRFIIR